MYARRIIVIDESFARKLMGKEIDKVIAGLQEAAKQIGFAASFDAALQMSISGDNITLKSGKCFIRLTLTFLMVLRIFVSMEKVMRKMSLKR